jgi:hypothetical protein
MNNLNERLDRLENQNKILGEQNTKLRKGYKRMKLLGSLALILCVGATMIAAGGERGIWNWTGSAFQVDVTDSIEMTSDFMSRYGGADIHLGDWNTNWLELNSNLMIAQQAQDIYIDAWNDLSLYGNESASIGSYNELILQSYTDVLVRDLVDWSSFSLYDLKTQVDALQLQVDSCCGAAACAADLDENGTVQVADLLELIAAWGPCS